MLEFLSLHFDSMFNHQMQGFSLCLLKNSFSTAMPMAGCLLYSFCTLIESTERAWLSQLENQRAQRATMSFLDSVLSIENILLTSWAG